MRKFVILILGLALFFVGSAIAESGGIEASKQISFVGENGSEITSTEGICLSSTCNTIEAGSSFTMSVVNARTETNSRFIMESPNTPLELTHNIRVDSLGDIPSFGKVTAFMEGNIIEGSGDSTCSNGYPASYSKIEFSERSEIDGYVSLFDKDMSWVSGSRRV